MQILKTLLRRETHFLRKGLFISGVYAFVETDQGCLYLESSPTESSEPFAPPLDALIYRLPNMVMVDLLQEATPEGWRFSGDGLSLVDWMAGRAGIEAIGKVSGHPEGATLMTALFGTPKITRIITISYYGGVRPKVAGIDESLIEFVNAEVVLTHGGVHIYPVMCNDQDTSSADCYSVKCGLHIGDGPHVFDVNDLPFIPTGLIERYEVLYPDSAHKRVIAHAIDQKWLTKDGPSEDFLDFLIEKAR